MTEIADKERHVAEAAEFVGSLGPMGSIPEDSDASLTLY